MSGKRGEDKTQRIVVFYIPIGFVLIADQLTKLLAEHFLSSFDTLPIIPNFFHLTLVHNTGIAFGFFRQHPEILLLAISASLIFLFVWSYRSLHFTPVQRICLAVILGGAAGNWIDRLRVGAVIDFLDFRIWPVFNLADSAITIGVAVFIWTLMRKKTMQ